ncbi:MAG: PGPGW domain-containing protein [Actinomycetota bacterium]
MAIDYEDLQPGIQPGEQATGTKRIIQIIAGVLLVVAGIAMLVLPGPGLVAIAVGLNLIKPDNALVRWMRRRVPGLPEEGRVPNSYLALGAVLLVGSTTVAILWGQDINNWIRDLVGV